MNRAMRITDATGKLYPFSETQMFQKQISQQVHDTWFSIKEQEDDHGERSGLSLITMQIDATITVAAQFNVGRYPYVLWGVR